MKKLILRVLIAAITLGACWGAYRYVQKMPQRQQERPVAKVRQGDVVIRAFTRGEVRAVRSESLVAPNLMGTVQITQLAPIGAYAREKNLIVEFDDSEVQSRIDEDQLNLESTSEQIKRSEAELAIRDNQDQVDLLKQKYAVRRAELQVQRNELLSAIDQRKNLLNLEEAKRKLVQLETNIKATKDQSLAQLALLRQLRQRTVVELSREQQRLKQTRLLTSISGLVAIRQNAFGGSRQFGAQVPDIREGDQVMPGMPVADVLDLSELEVSAKVGELDRANLVEGQEAVIELDALAGKRIHGRIKGMSGTATSNVYSGDPSKKFDVTFSVDMKELLTTVGAEPEQIREILAMAEKNRNRPATRSIPLAASSMAGAPDSPGSGDTNGEGLPAFGPEQPGTGQDRQAAGRGGSASGGQGAAAGGSGQTTRAAMQAALGGRNTQDLSPEERQKLMSQSAQRSPGADQGGGRGGEAGGTGRGGRGGFGGARFTDQELAAAKLPSAPEEESGLQVLLRPGLLADVQIIIEKIPNAIHIPAQAVFERDGKPVVYVRRGGRFEERSIKLLKRSESTMVISEGLKTGEEVALENPTAQGGSKKQDKGKSGGGASPMGSVASGSKS